MSTNHTPFFTFTICILTVCISSYAAYQITGSVFGKSRIINLVNFGGLTTEAIDNFEVWRLLTSQMIHVHQKHMFYNVLSILFLGVLLERQIGFRYTLTIWVLAGGIGTLFSTQFGVPPWNTGTGASQAAFGLAGFSGILLTKKTTPRYLVLGALTFALVPALYLDFRSVGYPKPGHVLGFTLGVVIALFYFYRGKRKSLTLMN